ncbi:MAG: penicillin acylase family protein, partial [Acidobacteria bacterium]|nr:penicillin acylase family protein [Acidobacteriota bacterium]
MMLSRAAHRLVFVTTVAAVAVVSTPWPTVLLDAARPLADRVVIRRDTFGVPHIVGETEAAVGFGFGYAQAEDHAAEMARRYLSARGEAAKYLGPSWLDADLAA